jgi:hypothetical protein
MRGTMMTRGRGRGYARGRDGRDGAYSRRTPTTMMHKGWHH